MKNKILLIIIILVATSKLIIAQECTWIIYNNGTGGLILDTNSFESNNGICRAIIDTSLPNRLWQIAPVTKSFFDTTHSGLKAMQTDSLNPYSTKDSSAFIIFLDSTFTNMPNLPENGFNISFWHKFQTDTLLDLCYLQATNDSGATWITIDQNNQTFFGFWVQYKGSLNNYANGFVPKPLAWSGTSADWVREELCLTGMGIKNMKIPKRIGFRFLFTSDSVQTNKAGWIIDDVKISTAHWTSNISNINSYFKIAPNPVKNKHLQINYSQNLDATFNLFDVTGKLVLTTALKNSIYLNNAIAGLYFYTITLNNNKAQATGKLLIE